MLEFTTYFPFFFKFQNLTTFKKIFQMFLWEDPVLVLQKKRSCLLICLFLHYICIFLT